ncbi:MAG: lysine--tRNA ligase [Parcubacteria group bacterium CG1_02_39_15]|nr:MAG: lysine--tRNA ligase [Parcubacteria group bacterium CG1_02_39_15]
MATVDELRKIRLKKLEAIERAGLLVYPSKIKRTHAILEALENFDSLSQGQKEVVLVGRIRSLREHGGSTFLHIEDGSARSTSSGQAKIQAYFKKDKLGEKGYKFFLDNFDIGDFIEVRGVLFQTKKGERTIEVADFKMLAKSLLPLPEKWHGLKDIEERFRKRYLDLIFNPEVKKKFEIRSAIIKEIRNFMDGKGFLEVETPTLQPIYGGASAKPFKTHLNALDMTLYLRIAPELYLKRLLVGGIEKVYELGKCFRNEGMDRSHNPEYTHFEFYWAYSDYKDVMNLTEEMFESVIRKTSGKLEVDYEGKKINFKSPWPRVEFNQLLKKYAEVDFFEINEAAIKKEAKKLGVETEKEDGKAEVADKIFKKYCQAKIWDPTFVIHHPVESKPLAKALEKDSSKSANLQLIVAGWELINAYSEENNPIKQKKKFEKQEKLFESGLKEAQRIDKDYIEALEYGMPPAAGFGLGIDRLVALLTDSHSLREVILFPTMRPK